MGIEQMATTAEVHAGELMAPKRATSKVPGSLRPHRTLCVGLLYAITIVGVLALVARL